jgi:hypothetical protein
VTPGRVPAALAAILLSLTGAACGPAVATSLPDEPVEPPVRPSPPPPRPIVRLGPAGAPVAPPAGTPAAEPADEEPAPTAADPRPLATRLGTLSGRRCFAALDRARVPYRRIGEIDDVAYPIRLTGPVGGVTYRNPSRIPEVAMSSVVDCRLALALVELSAILRSHDIVAVTHFSIHRESHHGRPVETGGSTGHRGALAIDAALFHRRDGTVLSVLRDFKGRRGAPVCGSRAAPGATPAARALRDIVCRAAERHLFHVMLTPNHDRDHRNHFHLELRPDGVEWLYLR